MRPYAIMATAAVLALMAGVVAAASTSAPLLGALVPAGTSLLLGAHPDPYDHNFVYDVTGEADGTPVSCAATCTTIHENGSFHNYLLKTELPGGTEESLVIFEPDGRPSILEPAGTKVCGSVNAGVFSGTVGDATYTVAVAEYCAILEFSVSYGGTHYTGVLRE